MIIIILQKLTVAHLFRILLISFDYYRLINGFVYCRQAGHRSITTCSFSIFILREKKCIIIIIIITIIIIINIIITAVYFLLL